MNVLDNPIAYIPIGVAGFYQFTTTLVLNNNSHHKDRFKWKNLTSKHIKFKGITIIKTQFTSKETPYFCRCKYVLDKKRDDVCCGLMIYWRNLHGCINKKEVTS